MEAASKKSMKAMESATYGGPEILELVERPIPTPGPGELLVKVQATTVNRTDCGFLRGSPYIVRFFSGLGKPNSTVLGSELAGDVVAVGSGVSNYKVGDAIFGLVTDRHDFGCHAEYVLVPEDGSISKKPVGITYEEAAASLEGSWLANTFLKTIDIGPQSKILVNGASGSIGSAAVQICVHLGAEVTAVLGTENMDLGKKLGAHRVIDYKTEDFTACGEQFDAVCDAVGKSTFGACKKIMKPKSVYVSSEFGPYVQNPFWVLWTSMFGSKKVIFPIPKDDKSDVEFVKNLWEQKAYQAVIDRRYSIEQIPEAYRYAETEQKVGNLIIEIGDKSKLS